MCITYKIYVQFGQEALFTYADAKCQIAKHGTYTLNILKFSQIELKFFSTVHIKILHLNKKFIRLQKYFVIEAFT